MNIENLSLEAYQALVPTCTLEKDGNRVKFFVPTPNIKALVDTIFLTEPETIEWISGFNEGEVFLDIGANIGLYSLWATVSRHVKCYAFEPESLNFSVLMRNIFFNKLEARITAYPSALADKNGFGKLHLAAFDYGESCHAFGQILNYANEPFKPVLSQGCYATTIDELVKTETIPVPDYIKIDVDGLESKIIDGAQKTLENRGVQSLLVEINNEIPKDLKMIKYLETLGFKTKYANPSILAPINSVLNVILRR